jgi:hypothetical protein
MLDKKIQAKHLLGLENVKEILAKSDIESAIIKANQHLPLSMLIMPLDDDEQDRSRSISASYIPMDEDDLEHTELLQLYSQFPFKINNKQEPELARFLLACNILQPIGNFGFKDGQVCFRYVLVLKKYDLPDPEEILETFMMFEYALQTYQQLIEDVNDGKKNFDEGIIELNAFQ